MLNLYTRKLHEEKCIAGRRHLACRHELAEGDQSFRAQCESTICRWFASLFRSVLSVKWPLENANMNPFIILFESTLLKIKVLYWPLLFREEPLTTMEYFHSTKGS